MVSIVAFAYAQVSSANMTPAETKRLAKALAVELGFDRAGIAPAKSSPGAAHYRAWLAAGHAGEMTYLHRNVELRANPERLLPGARSIICVAVNYRRDEGTKQASPAAGRVSQYARGEDYHRVLRAMLEEYARRLRAAVPVAFEHRVFVDTGPVLERELAAAAGLGWIGKNTMLLHERLGSYLFLGEIFTTLEIEPDSPASDHCGNCTRCIDACPTKAITGPHNLDASRCIAYLTIEHRGELPAEFHEQIGDWVYGCDICQDVCPFNRKAPRGENSELVAELIPAYVPLLDLLRMRSGAYRRLTRGSAAARARRNMWRRNAAIALGNAEKLTDEERRALAEAAEDEDPSVRQAARQALARRRE